MEIIRRFDEVISEKANKHALDKIILDVNEEINKRLSFDLSEFGLSKLLFPSNKKIGIKDIIVKLIDERVKQSEEETHRVIKLRTKKDP